MTGPAAFRCMQCGSAAGTLHLADCSDSYLGTPHRADYVRCEDCDLVQQSPPPADVGALYAAYPVHAKKSWLYRAMRALVMKPSYFAARRFAARHADAERPLLVDYGCGDGWFLADCARLPIDRIGFERDAVHAERLAGQLGVPVHADAATLLAQAGGRADVVTMHFVLEHVTDLDATFATVARLLKPGGLFHFTMPDIASWEARLFGRAWHNLDCPRHISFPAGRTVRQLAARWGFEVRGSKGVPFPNGIAASVPVMLTGRYRTPLFLAALPLAILLARLFPGGSKAYSLVRI